jgi:hypothetical protein
MQVEPSSESGRGGAFGNWRPRGSGRCRSISTYLKCHARPEADGECRQAVGCSPHGLEGWRSPMTDLISCFIAMRRSRSPWIVCWMPR